MDKPFSYVQTFLLLYKYQSLQLLFFTDADAGKNAISVANILANPIIGTPLQINRNDHKSEIEFPIEFPNCFI